MNNRGTSASKSTIRLADVLIDVVKNRNVQIILESHSEHLLLRLMRRIAEEEISVNDTAFYFCQINDGVSEIERLNIDEYGNIRNWPQDFFGDSTGELIKKTKAEMQRRKVRNDGGDCRHKCYSGYQRTISTSFLGLC